MADSTDDQKPAGQTPEERQLLSGATSANRGTNLPPEPLTSSGIASERSAPVIKADEDGDLSRHLTDAGRLAQRMFGRLAETSSNWASNAATRINASRLNSANRRLSRMARTKISRPEEEDASASMTAANAAIRGSKDVSLLTALSSALDNEGMTNAQDRTNAILSRVHAFQQGSQTRYMTSNLAAQYQQVYLQRAHLQQSTLIGQVIERKLEAIKANTAASEIRKRTTMDVIRETAVRHVAEAVTSRLAESAVDFLGPLVNERVVNPLANLGKRWYHSQGIGAGAARRFVDVATAAKARASASSTNVSGKLIFIVPSVDGTDRSVVQLGDEPVALDDTAMRQAIKARIDGIMSRSEPTAIPGGASLFISAREFVIQTPLRERDVAGEQVYGICCGTMTDPTQIIKIVSDFTDFVESAGCHVDIDLAAPISRIANSLRDRMRQGAGFIKGLGSAVSDFYKDVTRQHIDVSSRASTARRRVGEALNTFNERIRSASTGQSTPDSHRPGTGEEAVEDVRAAATTFVRDRTRLEKAPYEDEIASEMQSPILSELESFHQDFSEHAAHSGDVSARIVSLLEQLASEGVAAGGGSEYSPNGRAPWWRRSLTDLIYGVGRGGVGLAKMYARGLGGTMRLFGSAIRSLNPIKQQAVEPFVDVYRKGEVRLGNPLLTARQLRSGVVFADGEPVGDVNDIDQPVIDPSTMKTLISQDDIEHGLVDVHGTPLSKRGARTSITGRLLNFTAGVAGTAARFGRYLFSKDNPLWGLYGKMFETAGSVVGAFGNILGGLARGVPGAAVGLGRLAAKAIGPLASMYKDMFGVGLDAVRMGVRGAGALLGRLFGFDVGKGGGIKRKDLEEVIGDRLDDIYELLADYTTRRKRPDSAEAGDADQDGDRDNSYKDYLQKIKDRRAARKSREDGDQSDTTAKSKGGVGSAALGGLAAMLENFRGKSKSSTPTTDTLEAKATDEDDDGGWMDAILTGAGATAAASAMGGLKGRAAKLLGRLFGKTAAKTATKTATKTAARTAAKTAAKTAASVGAKVAGKSLLKKIPLLGALAGGAFAVDRAMDGDFSGAVAELASGVVSLVPVLGTGASLAIDGWLAYRDFNKASSGYQKLQAARMEKYGISNPNEDQKKAILVLEDKIRDIVVKSNYDETLDVDDVRRIMPLFGFDQNSKEQYQYLAGWIHYRFRTVYSAFWAACRAYDIDLEEVSDVTDEQAEKILLTFENSLTTSLDDRIRSLLPTMAAYRQIVLHERPQPQPVGRDPQRPLNEDSEITETARRARSRRLARTGRVAQASPAPGTRRAIDRAAGRQPVTASTRLNGTGLVNPNQNDGLGSLSARYESGGRGSMAVGYDPNGGTSYGKYQLSSAQGTFNKFLEWLAGSGDATAMEIAQRLKEAGNPNTGSRDGAVPNEWRAIVQDGLMKDYEHRFIKETHYDALMNRLDEDLQARINKSTALQSVIWSTAVQHGSANGATIVARAASGAGEADDAAFLRKLYEDRSRQFNSSPSGIRASVTRRLGGEMRQALADMRRESQEGRPVQVAAADQPPAQSPTTDAPPEQPPSGPPSVERPVRRAPRHANALIPTKAPAAAASMEDTLQRPSFGRRDRGRVQERQVEVAAANEEQLQKAVANGNRESLTELSQMNQTLTRLLETMQTGLGDSGAIAQLGKAVKDNGERPVAVSVIQQPPPAPPLSSSRISSIDMSLSRKNNDG